MGRELSSGNRGWDKDEAQLGYQEEFPHGNGGQAMEVPKEVWNPHPWKCPRNSWCQGGDQSQVEPDDLRGLFQPQGFHNSYHCLSNTVQPSGSPPLLRSSMESWKQRFGSGFAPQILRAEEPKGFGSGFGVPSSHRS